MLAVSRVPAPGTTRHRHYFWLTSTERAVNIGSPIITGAVYIRQPEKVPRLAYVQLCGAGLSAVSTFVKSQVSGVG